MRFRAHMDKDEFRIVTYITLTGSTDMQYGRSLLEFQFHLEIEIYNNKAHARV